MGKEHRHAAIDAWAYRSGMRGWNTAYKVFFSVGALVTVIASDRLWVSLVTLYYMAALTVFLGKIRVWEYIRLLLTPSAFILLGGLAIAVQTGAASSALWSVNLFGGTLSVTGKGLAFAARTGWKALGAVSALYLLTLSTPMGEILSVFRKLHVPGMLLELMHLIYRYIFILSEQNRGQKDAAGARMGYQGFRTSLHTFGMELANLFVLSMKKSGTYYDAMEARGYEGDGMFWEEKNPLEPKTLWAAFFYAALVLAALYAGSRLSGIF